MATEPRRPLIAGNWKMNLNHLEAIALTQKLAFSLPEKRLAEVEVVVLPPFVDIRSVQTLIDGDRLLLGYGAQDLSPYQSGAYTGDVSGPMLAKLGCQYVIVGHSERRQIYGERDAQVAAKFAAARGAGLTPVLCVGETLEEREAGKTEEVVARQLGAVQFADGVLAYEPVWAIGTGRNATPEQAQAVHAFLRKRLSEDTAILYGGSVKAQNAAAIFAMPDVDGGLIGGASLVAEDFLAILQAAGTKGK